MDEQLIIKGLLVGWFIANYGPLQDFFEKWVKPFVYSGYVSNGLSCLKCLSFWSTIILGLVMTDTLHIYDAIAAAAIAYTYDRIINSFKIYL